MRKSRPALPLALLMIAAAGAAARPAPAPTVPSAPEDPLPSVGSLYRLSGGRTRMTNALWGENPENLRFGPNRRKVVIAALKGPGVITMIHFAFPGAMTLNRDTLLRIYWDGEKQPSVEAPLVDFFCDPNGALERVDSALINKKRGWNCYFPMPFRRSARVEVEYAPAHGRATGASWARNPCYAYVMYRTPVAIPKDAGYFHANWRQQTLYLGKEDYKVLEADGRGQFVGWNVTVRGVGSPTDGYPVDENVKFRVDGESEPSIEWQGLEDAFGFSYGFPPEDNDFPYTGYHKYYNGASAFRFLVNDRISFARSLRMTVGFGEHEGASWRVKYSRPELPLQFSSVAYWYQAEPHRPLGPSLATLDRRPTLFLASDEAHRKAGETLYLACGRREGDDEFVEKGWDYDLKQGYSYAGFPTTPNHCWADTNEVQLDITCPKGASGTLHLYILDGDNFKGGRREAVSVAGKEVGQYADFQSGRWIDVPVSASETVNGRIPVVIRNLNPASNAVVSLVRFTKDA